MTQIEALQKTVHKLFGGIREKAEDSGINEWNVSAETRNNLVIHTSRSVPWQYPVIAEKAVYESLYRNPGQIEAEYFALPWATILEWINKKEYKLKAQKFQKLNKHASVFTVCQSIYYRSLCLFFSSIGVNVCFASHATMEDTKIFAEHNIELVPFPLFAVNTANPNNKKDLLYSFVGMSDHPLLMSDVRRRILAMEHPADTYIRGRGRRWHYEKRLYKEQISNKRMTAKEKGVENNNTREFMDVLARSRYSLCPSGTGPNTIRFWESLGSGAIPVLLSDKMLLPKYDWDSCLLRIPESDLEKVPQILERIPVEKESMMRSRCLEAYKQYSGNNFASVILDYYATV